MTILWRKPSVFGGLKNDMAGKTNVNGLITNLRKMQRIVEEYDVEDEDFRDFIIRRYTGHGDESFYATIRQIYENVVELIDCTECANCCVEVDIPVNDNDIEILARKLKMSAENFKNKYISATVFGQEIQKPCPFLENKRCIHYNERPQICRTYPFDLRELIEKLPGSIFANYTLCPIMFNVYQRIKSYYWDEYVQDEML